DSANIDEVCDWEMAMVRHDEQRDLVAVRESIDRLQQPTHFTVGPDDRLTRPLRMDPVAMNYLVGLSEVSEDQARPPISGHFEIVDDLTRPFRLTGILRELPRHFPFRRHIGG